jgi:hypothetical protein
MRLPFRILIGVLLLAGVSCQSAGEQEQEDIASSQANITGDVTAETLGFESPNYWQLTQGTVGKLQTSAVRTQGNAALAVVRPSGYVRIDSHSLTSSNAALAGLTAGATAAIDISVPTAQANPYWYGAVQMFLNCPSRNLYNVYMGQVELTGKPTGVFQTLRFKLPDTAIQALAGKTFSDLKFGVVINVPQNSPGTYLVDNLRLKNSTLPPRPTDITGIHKGQSTTLVAWKSYVSGVADQVANVTFAPSIVQVPKSLHVVKGSAGSGTVTLQLGLTGGGTATCQFNAEVSGANYVLSTCNNGAKAGDLLPATSAKLTVNAADAAQPKTKIKAQLALNPVGDEIVQGLPPIPTWLGGTTAELVAGLDAFVQAQQNWQLTDNVRVLLPTPDFDIHDSVSVNGALPILPPSSTDPQFGLDGSLTGTDMADAQWHLAGSIDAPVDPDGTRRTHFDAAVWSDVLLIGFRIGPIIKLSALADASTPPIQNNQVGTSTGSARFCYSYLGVTEQCETRDGQFGGSITLFDYHPSVTLFSLNWWVFHVGASGGLDVKALASGGFTPNGIAATFTPSLGVNATLEGGVSVGTFGGGGVYGRVDLLRASVPIAAAVSASANLDPRVCSVTTSETLSGSVQMNVGSGQIGYYLEGGLTCGFFSGLCWRDEETLFDWNGLSKSYTIIPAQPLGQQTIPLPAAFCTVSGDADGGIDYPAANQSIPQAADSVLLAHFERTIATDPPPDWPPGTPYIILPTPLDCQYYTWSSSDPSDVITAAPGQPAGCSPRIVYGNPGPRTISVIANDPALGTGVGSVSITITPSIANSPTALITSIDTGNCTSMGHATGTDPMGQSLTFSWFTEPANGTLATGSDPFLGSEYGGPVVRVVATATDGRTGVYEVQEVWFCIT